MSSLTIKRVNSLPAIKSASTMYIVKGSENNHAEVYFTSDDGLTTRHLINQDEIQTLINSTLTDVISSNVLGVNQTWQAVTRVSGQTYLNDTGRPIEFRVQSDPQVLRANGFFSVVINGVSIIIAGETYSTSGSTAVGSIIIPVGASYKPVEMNFGNYSCFELR